MRKRCAFCLAVICLVAWGSTAQAAGAKGKKTPFKDGNPTPETIFKYLDKDSDGKLTLKEFMDVKVGAEATEAEQRFKDWDKDNDNALTLEEYKAGVDSIPPQSKQKANPKRKKKAG